MTPIEALSQILSNNIGNRLTIELAHGIVSVFSQSIPQKPDQAPDRDASVGPCGAE